MYVFNTEDLIVSQDKGGVVVIRQESHTVGVRIRLPYSITLT